MLYSISLTNHFYIFVSVIATKATYEKLSRQDLIVTVVKLQHELDQLKRLVFGSKQERFIPAISPDQLALGLNGLQNEYGRVLPQSPMGKAIRYSLERWNKLSLYVSDGKLEIDNNLVENTIRPVALGRKNYLFAGSHRAAQNAAMLYSFLGTCKINNVNPYEWMTDVLKRIPSHPVNKLEELLLHKWKLTTSPQTQNSH